MKITFKDVGQGDSILLEWTDDEKQKIGIIDCNKKDKANPVLDYVDSEDYNEIEFIILSHPHSDHYSGMVDLLNGLDKKGITIKIFAHTLHFLANDYYKYLNKVEIDTKALADLRELIDLVDKLRKKDLIRAIDFIVENWQIELNDKISIKCLSPSAIEAEKYINSVKMEPTKNKKDASKSANYLSTLFKISTKEKYYLLTSDTEADAFERIVLQNRHKNLLNKEMCICQLPHHGSSKNFHEAFWDFIKKVDKPQAFISAGLNEKYKHPHFPVLESFHKKGYVIHSTNIVYGMIEYVQYLKELSNISSKLDTFSELVSTHTGGDKTFIIE